ncbi:hypothetical protein [Salegentibacter sediminis]|uniref:hypothetical protein n=1 Tax=Salegentibacter sediminis TaxID=1930251 RepID=UPI0009C0A65A|nr:hypothetical protein [Salegentibacter sediminis]
MDINTLEFLIKLSLIFLLVNILMTFFTAQWRRYNNTRKRQIEKVFAEQISSFLYPLPGETPNFIKVQRALRNIGIKESKPASVQFLIRLMIRTQQALGGSNHEKLQELYSQIPPYRASISKVQRKDWFQKARGIREIYEMDQRQYLKEIAIYRDHKNVYLRRESQIALVCFLGWESLRFLPYLSRKISLWQQIKIVEKLHDICKQPKVEYLRKAYTTKNPDAIELIIRIIKKFYLSSEAKFVFEHLKHENYEVRKAAIYCLLSLGVKQTLIRDQLQEVLHEIPSEIQQRQIMKYLAKSNKEVPTSAPPYKEEVVL